MGLPNPYDNEKWVELYRAAMLEIKHSLMAGRILEARTEIVARVEKLRDVPGLQAEELQAIQDALNGLGMLEREEVQYAADQQRKLAKEALEKLESIAPRIAELDSKTEKR